MRSSRRSRKYAAAACGRRLADLAPIKQAVATYVGRAAEKLRAQGSLCKRMRVSIRTGMFNPQEPHHAQGALVELPYPTCDTLLMTGWLRQRSSKSSAPGFATARPRCC